ncbi:MAG TPA: ABC transporter substrate-binding protein [Stellaceae bacterium]|jgi:branched-chain amino acid transport system substrate-binding protein
MSARSAVSAAAVLLASAAAAAPAAAQISDGVVKIGVLTDMSGVYARLTGEGSVVATKMAVEDCLKAECAGMKIEVISADHQNKADVAAAIARRWIDEEKVDAFGDLVNASVQLAVQAIVKDRDRVALYPGGTTRLTNEDCAPENSVQWMWDTYSQVAAVVKPLAKPGSKWFFLTADYAFGAALQNDATAIVTRQGGTVVGSARHPLGANDFSSFILQAQGSDADFIGLANAGGDTINAVKQASEFGVLGGGGASAKQKVVGFVMMLPEVESIGLKLAQGATLAEGFYWDLDDETRAWSKQFEAAYGKGKPTMIQAGAYSATLHYLKAVAAAKTDSAKAVVRKMHELPIKDAIVRNARLREDGRMVHDFYLMRVKAPAESKGPDDIYDLVATIKGDDAFKPLSESACPAVRK